MSSRHAGAILTVPPLLDEYASVAEAARLATATCLARRAGRGYRREMTDEDASGGERGDGGEAGPISPAGFIILSAGTNLVGVTLMIAFLLTWDPPHVPFASLVGGGILAACTFVRYSWQVAVAGPHGPRQRPVFRRVLLLQLLSWPTLMGGWMLLRTIEAFFR